MAVFRKDPCGIACFLLTYGAIFYADYVVIDWIILQTMHDNLWGALHALLFNCVVFMTAMAHLRAVFSDPGIVPLPQNRLDFSDSSVDYHLRTDGKSDDWTVCPRCEMYRPPRAHHCRICQRCIRRMDHHCPWINNCVGEWNQKYFMQFLIFVGILSCYSLSLVAYSWIKRCLHCSSDVLIKQGRMLHSILLCMESLLFALFVIAILCDQFQAIFSDETAIEQRKKQGSFRAGRPKMVLLREVCGKSHPALWVFPCTNGPRGNSDPLHSLSV